ncbi:MAG: leucyl aminopeptidase [Paracoccaceae bacterium]|jgi:leucyl aminopeptidase
MNLTFASNSATALPLYLIEQEALRAWLTTQPPNMQNWLSANSFSAKLGNLCLMQAADGSVSGAVLGFGSQNSRDKMRFGALQNITKLPAGTWALATALSSQDQEEFSLGWFLAQYRFDRYKSSPAEPVVRDLMCPKDCDSMRLLAMAEAECLTRDLINTPANDMGPDALEAAFCTLVDRFDATLDVIKGDQLLAQNFPLIYAVGCAATQAPRLLSLRWGSRGPLVTLVGKGVCFDTGGLDIKPSAGMLLMKKDMGGAANVMGLAQMIMSLKLPIRLRVLIPAVENSISSQSMRPSDIVISRKGLWVEINNTDAEGRLILADALAYGCDEMPDLIISMATLTGAARVALGPDLAPFFTDDEASALALQQAAGLMCDPVWRMPFWAPYEPMIDAKMGDLDNAPTGGFAGAITAALFLRRFVDAPRYIHFDIYGHNPSDAPARPKGGVGQGARAIFAALPKILDL